MITEAKARERADEQWELVDMTLAAELPAGVAKLLVRHIKKAVRAELLCHQVIRAELALGIRVDETVDVGEVGLR